MVRTGRSNSSPLGLVHSPCASSREEVLGRHTRCRPGLKVLGLRASQASTFSPLTWTFFGGGEGTRTLGLYIAKVGFSAF